MAVVEVLGTESLGVRGLSSCIKDKDEYVLIDPGVALGFTRWHLHPHPVQAIAGDLVRSKIKRCWKEAKYIILTHMHGDHVPLYNANPFQLNLYDLEINVSAKILAPSDKFLNTREKVRLSKIKEIYKNNVLVIKEKECTLGPIKVLGPFPHGLSKSYVNIVAVDLGVKVAHLSDTGLLVDEVPIALKSVRPEIVITDGPPLYRYLNNESLVKLLLERAERNLSLLAKGADKIIIDHHVNRCDKGYEWLMKIKDEYSAVTSAAEYLGLKPLLLEAWRRTLYKYFPVPNDWFKEGYQYYLRRYMEVYKNIRNKFIDVEGVSEASFERFLQKEIVAT